MQPNGNVIVDTICRTAELGETITKATEHGDSYRHRSRAHRAPSTNAPRAGSLEYCATTSSAA
ncbi:hypothetical protein [Corynebacterium diphtheriae]|uniref:hypothetical protein n=1 Tax=Corynebacterium diphtheriae TaxID=1717 RepID=UPI0018CA11B9|nr:hypothetical protein [Corynebacterium diphtheriae]MBG9294432.1 hypothetical protein [Corynebacterium diphtheriae bv. mitis]